MLMNMGEQHKLIKPAYQLNSDDVLVQLGSSLEGLDEVESERRLQQYGLNELEAVNKESTLFKFIKQFKDLMLILLISSAGIATYLEDYKTAIILFILVISNALIGFWQEFKADNIMASLESLVVPTAKVYRNGQLSEIPTPLIVPGDILYISEGDSIPADGRILSENELSTNDFALTGESNPSRKFTHSLKQTTQLALRHNLVFMGTTVAMGDAKVAVIGTGMHTELGRIANLSQETKQELSPLQKEINYTAVTLTKAVIGLAALLIVIALQQDFALKESFIFAIGIAAALVPNGLPAAINATLAQAAGVLAKSKALVKRLSAVETLGATSVICTDKTGTLTKNQMTVEQLYIGETPYWVSGTGYETNGSVLNKNKQPLSDKELNRHDLFFAACLFASNASVHEADEQHGSNYVLGDPTEGALIVLGRKAKYNEEYLYDKHPEIKEFPFDSVRKLMSSVRNYEGKTHIFVKGAPESVIEASSHILIDGKSVKMNAKHRQHILSRNEMLASAAMRNLAVAYKPLGRTDPKHITMDGAESELIFLGMASMIDPPRDEIPAAMAAAARAHIPICVITGDNALTATAIAIKAGLASNANELKLVQGEELKTMDDNQIIHLLARGQVIFSRVAPEDKLRIVELGKSAGQVVAVTGDGINDAPALKRADIGVAMGITGTDVAKQSADIVLLDDSFNTLVKAIQEGRIIYQNIRKIMFGVLTGNTSELFTILISIVAFGVWHIPIAITVILILAIDLVAELFPVAALGWDGADEKIMDEPPRNPKSHIVNKFSIFDLALSGLFVGVLTYGNYLLFFERNGVSPIRVDETNPELYASAITLTYITICLCMFANILVRRTSTYRQSLFSKYLWSNKQLIWAFVLSLGCMAAIAYVPFIQKYMGSGSVNTTDWILAATCGLLYLTARSVAIMPLNRQAQKA